MEIKKENYNNGTIYSMEGATLYMEKFENVSNKRVPFIVSDVKEIMCKLGINKEITYITSIIVNNQNEGLGSLLINECIQDNKDDIIVLKAEPIFKTEEEYKNALNSGEFHKKLSKLCNFYEKNNFVNINDYLDYELAIAFIYNNYLGEKIVKYISEITAINSILKYISEDKEGIFGDYTLECDVSSMLITKEGKYLKVYSQYNLYQTNYKETFEELISKLKRMDFKSAKIEELEQYNIS